MILLGNDFISKICSGNISVILKLSSGVQPGGDCGKLIQEHIHNRWFWHLTSSDSGGFSWFIPVIEESGFTVHHHEVGMTLRRICIAHFCTQHWPVFHILGINPTRVLPNRFIHVNVEQMVWCCLLLIWSQQHYLIGVYRTFFFQNFLQFLISQPPVARGSNNIFIEM